MILYTILLKNNMVSMKTKCFLLNIINLVRVGKTTHTTHDTEDVVVRGVDANLGG